MFEAKFAARNQVQTAVSGSLSTLWAYMDRFRFLIPLSFPRKRESRRLQSLPPEIKYKQQSADSFPLYGLIWIGFDFSSPVIPAKAGIQTIEAKPATRNQVQIAAGGSLPPLWDCMRRPEHGGRLRVSVRIRIFRISGISMISLRPTCVSRHNLKSRQDEFR